MDAKPEPFDSSDSTDAVSRSRPIATQPYILAALAFVIYATHSLLRQRRMATHGYDLGIFEQVVRSYAHFDPPVSEIRGLGFNTLGEHFHPILVLLAPVYRVFPSANTLLLAQAALLAVSVVPITRAASRVLGSLGGGAVGGAYAISWGIQSAVDFDFHEVCFAVPLLAFGLERFLLGRYRATLLWWLPLLLVKEDLGLTIAAATIPLAAARQRKMAAVHLCLGLAGFIATIFAILPSLNPHGTFAFWGSYDGSTENNTSNNGTPLGDVPIRQLIVDLPKEMILPREKWLTLFTLLVPTGFIALRSPLIAMLVPTLLWRFTSDNSLYWETRFHYSAVLMPIVFAAFLDGVRRLRDARTDWLRRYAAKAAIVPLIACLALARDFPLVDLFRADSWHVPDRVLAARRILDTVPDGAQVTVTEHFGPQLTSRTRVTEFPNVLPGPGYAVIEFWDGYADWGKHAVESLTAEGFEQIVEAEGTVLLKRS
ncbi:DUF2079 domain-containing protein [Embleya sp. NPDC001921]